MLTNTAILNSQKIFITIRFYLLNLYFKLIAKYFLYIFNYDHFAN